MPNKLKVIAVAFGFLFIGGTALYDYVFAEKEKTLPILAAAELEAERSALVAATVGGGTWERFTKIVRNNVVLSASFRAGDDQIYPAGAINRHFEKSGWSLCEKTAPTALQTFAKGEYRASMYSSTRGETYRISFSTRLHANDEDCVRATR